MATTNNCISQLSVANVLYDIKDTAARDILSSGFFEQTIYEDSFFNDVEVPEGKVLTFIGYNTGLSGGTIVTRFKDSNGAFGTVGQDLSIGYNEEEEMILLNSVDDGTMTLNIIDDDSSMQVDNGTLIVS